MEHPITTTNIHCAPKTAQLHAETSSVCISASDPYYVGSSVTFFCEDAALARALVDAINTTLEAHRASPAAPMSEAAE